jgi:hypothetical protein
MSPLLKSKSRFLINLKFFFVQGKGLINIKKGKERKKFLNVLEYLDKTYYERKTITIK